MEEVQCWQPFTFGAWNVRSFSKKEADVVAEIERENEDIVVLSETKLRGVGKKDLGNYIHLYSGVLYKGGLPRAGVSILIKKKHCENHLKYEAVNERIIWAELCLCGRKVVVIGAYMVDECRSEEQKDAFISKLKEVILDIDSGTEVIILGDFNAHVGQAVNNPVVGNYGVKESNNNGARLKTLCSELNLSIQNTFFHHKDIHKYTWYGNGTKKSIVDYCITRQESAFKVLDVVACRWLECGTDHIFLEATIAIPFIAKIQHNCSENSINNLNKYKSFLLFSKTYQAAYKNCLDSLVDINLSRTKSIAEVYEHLREIIHTSADHVLGCVDKNTFGQFLWDKEIMDLRQLRVKHGNDELSLSHSIDFNNNVDPKTKNEVWMGICREINSKEKCKKLKVIQGILAELLNVSGILNVTVSSDIKTLQDTLKKRFTETRDGLKSTFSNNNLDNTDEICSPIISINDIEMAFDDIDYNNYPTPGGFYINLLKFSSTKTKIVLRNILQCILNGEEIPPEIKEVYVIVQSDLNPISEIIVLHPILNLVCSLVKKELENLDSFKGSCISCEQLLDTAFIMRLLIQKNATKQETVFHSVVIDLVSSYCSVPLEKILMKLQKAGVSAGMTNLIRSLMIGNSIRIVKDGELSEAIELSKGLISSCSLASLLFRFYISTALTSWAYEIEDRGIRIGVKRLFFIYSSDKLILLSKTKPGLEFMVKKLKENFERIGIVLNSEMVSYLGDTNLKLGNDLIPGQQEVDFQGWVLEKDGTNNKDVEKRMHEAKAVIGLLHPCARDEMLSDRTKRQIFNSIIKGIMTFGCETWTLTDTLKRTIDATELRYWKWCCERFGEQALTAYSMYDLMCVKHTASAVVMLKKAAWYTRMKEMSKDFWVRRVLDWEPVGKRKAARPRTKWVDGVEEFITSMGYLLKRDRSGKHMLKNVLPGNNNLDNLTYC